MAAVTELPGGVVHDLPDDLAAAIQADGPASATWQGISPLARNEWICWVEDAKKAETRAKRISWGCESLNRGKRRPLLLAGLQASLTRLRLPRCLADLSQPAEQAILLSA